MLSQNEMQLHLVLQLVNSQWAAYQDTMKKNNKNKMHNPSLEGLYQTLTKQQEIIYKQRENIILLKNRIGLRDDGRKQKQQHSNVQMESLSDSLISMSLADQVQNERCKFTDKKLKNLKNILMSRDVVVIKPQRPERLGLNSEIILEKRNRIIRTMNTTPKAAPTPTALLQNAPARVPFIPDPLLLMPIGIPVSSIMQKKPSATQKKEDFPKFSISTGAQQGIGGFNAPTVQKPMVVSGFASNQPFQTPPAPLGFDLGKRKDSSTSNTSSVVPQSVSIVPQLEPLKLSTVKPSTTIANANIAVSATFSIPLANKVTSTASSKDPKVVEKKVEDSNPASDNATYTFKVAEKKDSVVTLKAPLATTPAAFEFNSAGISTFSFGGTASSKAPESKTIGAPAVITSSSGFSGFGGSASFTGFGSKPSEGFGAQSSSSSTSTSVFGSGATPAFGGFGGGSSTGFGLNLTGNDNTPKSAAATSGSDSFSFVSSLSTTTSSDGKTTIQPTKTPAATSTFSLGQTTISAVTAATTSNTQTPPTSTFSFANFGVSSSSPTVTSALAAALKPDPEKLSTTTTTSTSDTVLQGLNICSPELTPKSVTKSPSATSIFGSASTFNTATNSDSSTSIFGGSASITKVDNSLSFGAALNLTPSSTAQTSIFGATTPSTSSPSLFGALNLSSNADANKVTATSPPSGLFSSLVKPDQSVFGSPTAPAISSPFGGAISTGAPAAASPFGGLATTGAATTGSPFGGSVTTPAPAAASPFGGIFANATNNASSSVFGGTTTNNSGSIFGGASTTQTSAFGGTAAFGSTATTAPSVFGATTGGNSVFSNNNTTAQTGGSIFGGFGNAQPASSGSIFGGSGTTPASTPFGGSSVFGGSPAASQQSSFGGSVFGGGNTNTR